MSYKSDLYTVEEAADVLKVTKPTIYRLIREKGLPTAQLGERMTRIPKQALEDWVQEQIDEREEVSLDHVKDDLK